MTSRTPLTLLALLAALGGLPHIPAPPARTERDPKIAVEKIEFAANRRARRNAKRLARSKGLK